MSDPGISQAFIDIIVEATRRDKGRWAWSRTCAWNMFPFRRTDELLASL